MTLNIEYVREKWQQRGFSCDLWIDPPGQRWEGYVHDTDEMVMIVEGEIEFETEGMPQCPNPAEELFIPAGAVHSVRNLGPMQSRWLYGYGQNQLAGNDLRSAAEVASLNS
jgi:mannose-6-phosphate isomerase-like protein (cupin superfamily)